MKLRAPDHVVKWPSLAWASLVLAGILAPATAILAISGTSPAEKPAIILGSILALSLMGSGMISAAICSRFRVGVIGSVLVCSALAALVFASGFAVSIDIPAAAIAMIVASISFAARGALFARNARGNGWIVALLILAGEAAILLAALVQPDAWPAWLLALLPAQWASMALQAALGSEGILAASVPLIALGGTAAATMFVVRLGPRRWTYLVMFTTWLALSALVYQSGQPS